MNSTNYEEKRKHPRVIVEQPLSMVLSSGDVLSVSLYDISLGGIQVRCDKSTAHQFQNEYETIKEKGTTRFNVTFKLPFKDHDKTLEAVCRMIYILKIGSEGIYAIGMEFAVLKGANNNILKEFIGSLVS